jgi:hypothetical protein
MNVIVTHNLSTYFPVKTFAKMTITSKRGDFKLENEKYSQGFGFAYRGMVKKLDKSDIKNQLIDFKNEVLCRRNSNQEKAKKLFNNFKNFLNPEQNKEIVIEWSHYDLNHINTETFGIIIDNIIEKYKN